MPGAGVSAGRSWLPSRIMPGRAAITRWWPLTGENDRALAFHRALGYVDVGRLPEQGRKFDRWLDLVLLQKFL